MGKRIQRIDKVLQKALRKMELDTKLEGYRVWRVWPDIVGDQIAKRAQPERLKNRILFVRVSSSTWIQQLQTMKPMLLERIQRSIPAEAIKDIRFSLGEVLEPTPVSSGLRVGVEPVGVSLSAEMEASLEQIGDSELKALMKSLALKQAGGGAGEEED
jgi:hypothetical protein